MTMTDFTSPDAQAPEDVPPVPSPGGTVADRYRDQARGRAGAGTGRASRPKQPTPAPTEPTEEDLKRPLSTAEKNLREAILDLYTSAQMLAFMADPPTALSIEHTKEKCADAWMDLSRRDRRVKAMLIRLTTGSAWGGVMMAHLPILLPLLARKGILPGGALFGGAPFQAMDGMVPPSDGGSVTDDWPYGASPFGGTVPFSENGNGGHAT